MECEESLQHLDRVIEEVRRICRDLSPSILENLGFAAAVRWLVDNFAKTYQIKVSVDAVEIDHLFPREAQIVIYRIFQEALGNVGKHAQAKHVTIRIQNQNGAVDFFIEDDGKGFDVKQALMRGPAERGLGLPVMEERAHMLGGALDLQSGEGRGTSIAFNIPIEGGPDGQLPRGLGR